MDEILKEIENMSEQEVAELLAVDFGDLEKQAEAELAGADLANALYSYGAHMAVREVEEGEELSKEASEQLDQEHEEITAAIEQGLLETGILDTEDTAELHKEAQEAAALIFAGYSDTLEKIAKKDASKMDKMIAWAKRKGKAAKKAIGEAAEKGMKAAKKHKKGLAIAGGVGALGAGAYAYKKHHEKKASEVSASELAEIIAEEQLVDSVIEAGIDKLAKAGAAKAGKGLVDSVVAGAKKLKKQTVDFAKKNPKTAIGLGMAGSAGAGYALGKKKD